MKQRIHSNVMLFIAAVVAVSLHSVSALSQTDTTGAFRLRQYTLFIGSEYYFCTMDDKIIYGKVLSYNE
ncbi:MAG: hypothetical protein LWX07_10515, partial [Bacteroidetes bacterium]|nr:hypothetical protein [Bacteroidota bacterium]